MKRVWSIFKRRKLESELAGEIASHIEETVDQLIEAGMSREEAVFAAKRRFGNPTLLLERGQEVWSFPVLENLIRDFRIGLRSLAKAPLFTTMAVAILALGIGANCAVFSLIYAVLLRPLSFPDAQRIVVLWERPAHESRHNPVSPINFLDWRNRTRSFDSMAAVFSIPMNLSGMGEPRAVDGLEVSADFFRVLGVRPLLGRAFKANEDIPNGPHLVVLSYALWRGQFGADPAILGRTIRLLDRPSTVIGVMPEGFDLPFEHADLWIPAQIAPGMEKDEGRYLEVIARLNSGISLNQAQQDLSRVARQISRERPFTNLDWGAMVLPLYDQVVGNVRTALLALFAAVALVLLIAAANVANLLLMRGTQRQHEIAVRTALGASRARVISQLIVESFLLSVAGSVAGVALAYAGIRAATLSLPSLNLPRVNHLEIDTHVLIFSLLLCLATTLAFGLMPAFVSSRTDPNDALKQGGQRSTGQRSGRTRALLVIFEVALSLVLLAGAGLFLRSFARLVSVDRGFRIDHILTMRMFLSPGRYLDDSRRAQYVETILDRVRELPGVEGASSAHFLPMTGDVSGSCFTRSDRPKPPAGLAPVANFLIVSPGYFSVMGIPLLSGRDFNPHDIFQSSHVILINQAFARQFFPNEDPVGKKLDLCWGEFNWGVIVGVTANARQTELAETPKPTIFLDHAQAPMYFASLVVRTSLPPSAVVSPIERAIHTVDPNQAVYKVESMEQVVSESVARPRVESSLLAIFAGIALVLAAVGLYGVLAYSVSQRTQEIGVRVALGAEPSQLIRDVVRDALKLVLPGIVLGLVVAFTMTRFLRSLLYEIKPGDPWTFTAVTVGLILVALIAAYVPARRASSIDPLTALRYE